MSEWIKCREQMPIKNGRYLVCEQYPYYRWIGISNIRDGKFDSPSTTHWMHLPEEPRNENE